MLDEKGSSPQSRLSIKNHILNALPDKDLERLLPDLKLINLDLGQILYRPEEKINYVYFLESAMISVVANTLSGQSAEVGVIGCEGIIGVDVFLGGDSTLNENVIQLPDGGFKIKTAVIRREFELCGAFHDLTLGFIRLLMMQISQTALCNRLHSVDERLARWLLLCHDRATTDNLPLTQEFLSIMLGTNRATVTVSAIKLQDVGYIKYKRGSIKIIDRAGLEDYSCDCYKTIKKEYDRATN